MIFAGCTRRGVCEPLVTLVGPMPLPHAPFPWFCHCRLSCWPSRRRPRVASVPVASEY